jgi:endoglucanase
VKIDFKYIKLTVLFVILNFSSSLFANTVDKCKTTDNQYQQLPLKLGGGINLSLLEHTWENAADLLSTNLEPKLKQIKNIGFKTVRLPVAFDMFLQANSSNLQIQLIDKLGDTYNKCHSLGLNLIITYHYGKIYYGSTNRFFERDRILWMWKQIQNKFRGMGYNDIFFELYNEPTHERAAWKDDATFLVNGLRWEDKERIYIVGGTNYNNADELLDFGKLNDDKILYTIHFYEPFLFTHQGAEWAKDKTYITNIPYPYSKKKMPAIADQAKGTTVEQDYFKYPAEGTKDFIALRLRRIADECKKRDMQLICTELGVIDLANEKSRNQYLYDVTDIMQQLAIPVVLWDFDRNFAVIKNGKPIKGIKNWLKINN